MTAQTRRHFRADTRVPRRQAGAYAAGELRIEQELAQIISGLRTGDMTELELLAAHLPNPVRAAVSGTGGKFGTGKRCRAQAVKYIGGHLFESLSVEKVADAVSLSPSHFSRLFHQHDRIFPARVHYAAPD